MKEKVGTSKKTGTRRRKSGQWRGEKMAMAFSNWIPQLLALKVLADQDPKHVLAASEQKRLQQWRNQLSA